jgi:hypothetical protein
MVMHACNPGTQEAEVKKIQSSRPAWVTKQVPSHAEQHRNTLSQKQTTKSWALVAHT